MTIFQEAYLVDVINDGHMTPLGGRCCGWQIVEDGYAKREDIEDMEVGDVKEMDFPIVGEFAIVKIERLE
jgi:hypothetical protein